MNILNTVGIVIEVVLGIVILFILIRVGIWFGKMITELFMCVVESINNFRNNRSGKQNTRTRVSHSGNSSSNTVSRPTHPYPMESGAINAAIGAVDKCCEFAAFCEKYVIPAGICQPEQMEGYIEATTDAIRFGFIWKTFCYSLDFLIEKQGFSIREGGFDFSDNSGMVSYQRTIKKDGAEYAAAYTWMMFTPVEEVVSSFARVAENNFTSLGLNNHNVICRCTHSDGSVKQFAFTVE